MISNDSMNYSDAFISGLLLKLNKIIKEKGKEEANRITDLIIKNTYRTLMTRGMKGCYIYCIDKKLEDYLKSLTNML